MIKISVDESFGYDLISIAQVKFLKSPSNATIANLERLLGEMESQIDPLLHKRVLSSPEYADLRDANLYLFEIFDEMKLPGKTECYDLKADRLNYRRFECKKALQAKFFPNSALTEVKLGYEKAQ